jgi:hypothetical protein
LDILTGKARDLSPVMRDIERSIMARERLSAWSGSGLKSQTGQLKRAVKTWSGKRSAGVSLKPGSNKKLLPIGSAMATGRKRGKQRRPRRALKVKGYRRRGGRVKSYTRKSLSRDIPSRPFIPDGVNAQNKSLIKKKIKEYLAQH